LKNCFISDANNKTIYPYYEALEDQTQDTVSLKPIAYFENLAVIDSGKPLSSPQLSATVSSVSFKTNNENKTLDSAIDAMLNGINVIGSTDYKPYLMCGNLHSCN
jgi:hypothetical protein